MSAELMAGLASSGMTQREAAASLGMSYWKFREFRSLHLDIPWQPSDKMRAAKSQRQKITAEIAAAIRADDRLGADIAEQYGINRSHVYNIKSGRRWPAT